MNLHDAALFALDAYNRATASEDLAIPFGAQVIFDRTDGQFAAVAYYLESSNELVVAYRGTDNPILDGATSYPIGAGHYDWPASQADQAFRFYNDLQAILADPDQDGHSASLVFTGHSLGGGLAGLVASINELPAFVYDSMPFTEAANKIPSDINGPLGSNYHYWKYLAFPDGNVHAPSFSLIQSAAIQGELLAALRWGEPFDFIGGITVTDGVEAERIVQNEIKAGTLTNQLDMHGQALLMIAMHGGLVQTDQRVTGGNVIYKHLFDTALSTRLGFADSESMRQILAYTVDDDTPRVLDGLFFDMDLLGGILLEQEAHGGPENRYVDVLGKLSLAHAIQTALPNSNNDLSVGLIRQINGTANVDLTGVQSASDTIHLFLQSISSVLQGQLFEISTEGLSNLAVAWSGYGGSAYLQPGGSIFFGSEYIDDVYGSDANDVIISMGSNATFFDNIWGGGGNDVIYASVGADTIDGGSGNDRIHGGAGNDTITGGTGSDAMFGGENIDTFHLGEALAGDVDYVNGGAGTDIVQLSVGATFRLDAAGAAAIRSTIIADGFAAPTGHGVGIELAVGTAFVQAAETFKAAAVANELHISKIADIVSSGARTFDFTAGSTDTAYLDGTDRYYITLSGNGGRSAAVQGNATSVAFLGVDEWKLAGLGTTVVVDKSHLGTQTVALRGNGTTDILDLQSFTTDIVYGLAPLVGGTNIIASGFERVYGGSGNDTFYGTDGDDVFQGNGGVNTFHGSLGADRYSSIGGHLLVDYSLSAAAILLDRSDATSALGRSSGSVLSMGRGDTLSTTGWSEIIGSTGSAGNEVLVVIGTHGTLRSNGGNDTLIGGSGNDTFHGSDGYAEIIQPGDGNDVIHFGTGGGTLDFSTSTRAGVIDLAANTFVFGNQFDTVTGEFTKLIGTQYGDRIDGTDNADIIDGGSGTGYDVIYGWGGDDTITFQTGTVHGGEGKDTIKALGSNAIIFGEGGDDTIIVGQNSLVYGGGNNDTITAGSGSTVHGDDGDDIISIIANAVGATVHGGAGGDTVTFNDAYSRSALSYEQSDAGVTLTRSGGLVIGAGGHAQGDKIAGTFTLVGSAFDDVFGYQVSNATTVKGGAGNDTIAISGNFNGAVHGGDGIDTITLFGGDTGYGDAGNDIFYGSGRMYGGADDDEFYLATGGAEVWGGTGSNHIEGGAGNDTIHMNEGADTFVRFANGGLDLIYGANADDRFVLGGIDGFASLSDVASHLVAGGSRTELIFDGNNQKIAFIGLTVSQVLALDWTFA